MRHSKALSLSLTVWVSISLLLSNAGPVFASDDRISQGSDRIIQEQSALSPSMKVGNSKQTQVNEPGLPTDRIIVKYKSSAQAFSSPQQVGQMERVSTAAGITLEYMRTMSGDSHVLQLPERLPLEQVQEISEQLMLLPEIEYAEPDLILKHGLTPNDPFYGSQWHYFGTYGINAPAAWDITTGSSNIVMAVIDTGITNHSDLSGRTVPGYDFVTDVLMANDGNGRDSDPSDPGDWISVADASGYFAGCQVSDSSWHGTHVAGTMGAASNNGVGVAGINWNSRILPVRVLGKCGGYTSDIVDGMLWAAGLPAPGAPANPNPARVLNLSLGGFGACGTTYQNAINSIVSAGSVVVVSAGNSTDDASNYRPANCSGVITVASTSAAGGRAYYSNYGSTVEISAPGGDFSSDTGVLSTLNTGTTVPVADTYESYQGTSMAAPHVSGVVSLMLSLNPYLTPSQVLQILQSTVKPFFSGGDCTTSICGAGIVDAEAAVKAIPPRINSFSPLSGAIGTIVTISGANFSRVTNVRFNGVSASFSIISPTTIRATVPVGATTGPISVTNPAATVTSGSNNFTVLSIIAGPGIYDDTDSAWSYAGTWTTLSTSGPYNNTLHQANNAGSYADLAFNGTQIKLTYLKASGRGSFDVYIDGGKVATINENNANTVWQATWTSSILTSRVHTLRIQSLGNGWIDLDAIQVFAPDITTPAAITTLSATTGVGNGVVNLGWTAVGDDGTSGTANSYLVRYSTSAILNETAWNNATAVTTGIPVPKAAGQAESMSVGGLTGGQMYYFSVRVLDEVPNLGGLSNSPSATASSAAGVGPGIYDDTTSVWSYVGAWNTLSTSGPYNNTLHQANNAGSYAEVSFNGTQVKLTYLKAPGRGSFDVYIDNFTTPVATISENNASVVWQASWTSAVLSNGTHTIRLKSRGDGWIDLDALQVFVPPTPVGSGIYDDTDSAWSYSGTWNTLSTSGPYNNTLHQANNAGSYAEVTFTGTQVMLTYLKAPSRGSFDVYIDNFTTPIATISENNGTIVWQASWTSAALSNGTHTIRIESVGNGWIDLDALTVLP